jgi:hypothetical protein
MEKKNSIMAHKCIISLKSKKLIEEIKIKSQIEIKEKYENVLNFVKVH